MTTMLFKCPGTEDIWGIKLQTQTVEDDQVEALLADGWHDHPYKARDAHEAEKAVVIAEVEKEVAAEVAVVAEKSVRAKPGPKPKA